MALPSWFQTSVQFRTKDEVKHETQAWRYSSGTGGHLDHGHRAGQPPARGHREPPRSLGPDLLGNRDRVHTRWIHLGLSGSRLGSTRIRDVGSPGLRGRTDGDRVFRAFLDAIRRTSRGTLSPPTIRLV